MRCMIGTAVVPQAAVVVLLLLPSVGVAAPSDTRPDDESMLVGRADALAEQWKPRFAQEKLHFLVAPPFVIAGDGTEAQLAKYRDQTLLAAMRALEAMYFEKKPTEPILVLLF